MAIPEKCFLTGHPAKVIQVAGGNYNVDCPVCGNYKIPRRDATVIPTRYPDSLHILAAITRRHSDDGGRLELHTGNVQNLLDAVNVPDGPFEQIDEIVKYAYKKTSHLGADIVINYKIDYPIAFAKHSEEFVSLLHQSKQLGYLKNSSRLSQLKDQKEGDNVCNLTLEGWQHFDELRRTGRDSNQAFVAMSFKKDDPTLMDAWKEGIKPALDETGWQPIRMDLLEHNEKIDDRMIAEIRRSGLLVADLTEHRQNVYFEAGFAMGLGIPVIYTCRESDAESVHFDMRQYKYIAWTDGADLRQKLRERIEATGLAKTLRENAGEN